MALIKPLVIIAFHLLKMISKKELIAHHFISQNFPTSYEISQLLRIWIKQSAFFLYCSNMQVFQTFDMSSKTVSTRKLDFSKGLFVLNSLSISKFGFWNFTFKKKKKKQQSISLRQGLHFYASLARQTFVLPRSGTAILKKVNLLFSQYADPHSNEQLLNIYHTVISVYHFITCHSVTNQHTI